jgi:hypothetical protein
VLDLVPVTTAHYGFIHALLTAPDQLATGRLQGQTPSPQLLEQVIWHGVLSQFVVTLDDRRPCALVSAYGASQRHGYAYISVQAEEAWRQTGLPMLALGRFLDHLFRTFPFRKLYAEMHRPTFDRVLTSQHSMFFEVEGRLREHHYVDGVFVDFLLLAVYRDRWVERRRSQGHAVERLLGTGPRP